MEVILLQNVDKLGERNQVVKVRPGYGRNFLLPQGLAMVANESNKRQLNDKIRQAIRQEEKMLADLNAIAEKLKAAPLRIGAKVGTSGKIFGSVTTVQLADAIKRQLAVTVDRKKLAITEEIKTLGTYAATVELHKSLTVDFQFEVVGE